MFLAPLFPGGAIRRYLFVSQKIALRLDNCWGNSSVDRRNGLLREQLDRFTLGYRISVGMDPFDKRKTAYMARLHPVRDGFWCIRSIDPRPSLRVFGGFAATDVFVALSVSERKELGGPKSRAWRDEIVRSKVAWRNLFAAYGPLKGNSVHDYLTDNVFVV